MAENVLAFNFLAKDNFSAVADKIGKKLDTVGHKLGGFGKTAAVALGGAAVGGVAAFGLAIVKGVKDAEDYQTLALKTAAVIKSTGNAAHISVGGIQSLASTLESLSGVDETLIINSENVLATFTNIRNQSGKNNDVFNQATKSALNLSVAMGEDLQSATVQIGKALNDPIKGITALTRVGVTFSAGQKEQIATMVKHGNTMGAQKIILKELNKEFGGAAKAAGSGFSGSLARAKDAIDDAFRSLGMLLLPTLTKVANWFANIGIPAVIKFAQTMGPILGKVIGVVVAWVRVNLLPVFTRLSTWFVRVGIPAIVSFARTMGPILAQAFRILSSVLGNVIRWVTTKLVPAWEGVGKRLAPMVTAAVKSITQAFHDHQDVIRGLITFVQFLSTVFQALGKLLVKYVIPFIGVLAAIIIKMIPPVVRILLTIIGAIISVIAAIVKYTPRVVAVIGGVITAITAPFRTASSFLVSAGRAILTGLVRGMNLVFVGIPRFIANIISTITRPFGNAIGWLVRAGRNVLQGLWNGIQAIGRSIASWFSGRGGFVSRITGVFSGARGWLASAGRNVLLGFLDGLKAIWNTITKWVGGIATWIAQHKGPISLDRRLLVPAGRAIMSGFYHGLTSGAGKAWDFVKSVGGKTVAELSSALNPGGGLLGGMHVQGGGNAANKALGQKMNALMGWGADWPALNNLWMGESGWNQYARNPSSGAYGIPQSLPASKMASAGGDWRTNAATQIRWGLGYIRAAYGNPANAYGKWLARSPHWYDRGGLARTSGFIPKLTNQPERVLSPRQTAWFERAMSAVGSGVAAGGRGTEAHFHFYNYVGDRQDLMRVLNQAARTGQLDAIVRLAR